MKLYGRYSCALGCMMLLSNHCGWACACFFVLTTPQRTSRKWCDIVACSYKPHPHPLICCRVTLPVCHGCCKLLLLFWSRWAQQQWQQLWKEGTHKWHRSSWMLVVSRSSSSSGSSVRAHHKLTAFSMSMHSTGADTQSKRTNELEQTPTSL